jgi:DNA-directed RNA polymerase subunit M/transcription elongation factor TFIIS
MSSASSSIRFCIKCDNKYYHRIQYPEHSDVDPVLMYYCRVCGHVDNEHKNTGMCVLDTQHGDDSNSIFSNIYNKYTKHDPTLPILRIPCPNTKCQTNKETQNETKTSEIVYVRYHAENMKFLYVCTTCDYKWNNENK